MRLALFGFSLLFAVALASQPSVAQEMPATTGESLSGHRVVLAELVRGHATLLVAGFSRKGGDGCGDWVKAVRADSALANVAVYQMAMLESAPGLFRGAIKNSMKKGFDAAEQDNFVVLTQDEKLWRKYFDVSDDQDPYVALIDAAGKIVWHGHGAAGNLEPMLKAALR